MSYPTKEQTALWSDAEYFAYDAVNASSLKHLVKSPQKYQWAKANPKPPTPTMTLGSAIHCLTFEPLAFTERYAVGENGSRRTKAYREWAEEQEGKAILTADEHEKALRTARAAAGHPLLNELLQHPGTQVERAMVWHGLFGLSKAKVDLVHNSPEHGIIVLDLKTTSSELDEHSITHTMGKWLVHLQLYHYMYAALAHFDISARMNTPVRLIALYARTSGPHEVAAFELGSQTLIDTHLLYENLAESFETCHTSGHWPGQPELRTIELPSYYSDIK